MCSADWCEVNDLDVGLQCLKQVQFFLEGSFGFILDFVICWMVQVVSLVLRCYS